jgi:large subunit ribosomal protein L13
VLEKAIKGMLPKNKLGRAQGKKLKVYAGATTAQQTESAEA